MSTMTNGQPLRILCVDDHHLVRDGLMLIINREPDLHVVATAATGEQAVSLFQQHRPDVAVVDLQLPTMSGLEVVRLMRAQTPDAPHHRPDRAR
jgi:DNA-binding NarL/FixJ family response regulator